MGNSNCPIRVLVAAAAIAAGLAPSWAAAAQNTSHVTFGTSGGDDGAAILVETESGDLVVAGSGASFWSDDGSIQPSGDPMVARINARGELEWQRVYADLANHRIIAFVAQGEEQYLVLERRSYRDTSANTRS